MSTTPNRRTGAAIAILAATGSVVGLTVGHIGIPFAGAIAVIGIAIGVNVARKKVATTPDATKKD
jgi:hypothetical protein